MSKNDNFNHTRRHILKSVVGVTATSIVTTSPGLAALHSRLLETESTGVVISCQLLYRDDGSRTYLLMHNRTDSDIVVTRFQGQTIRYENIILNLAEAFAKPVTIESQDRMLVRLNHKPDRAMVSANDIIEIGTDTSYPTVGTRVVDVPVRIYQGVGAIEDSIGSFA